MNDKTTNDDEKETMVLWMKAKAWEPRAGRDAKGGKGSNGKGGKGSDRKGGKTSYPNNGLLYNHHCPTLLEIITLAKKQRDCQAV